MFYRTILKMSFLPPMLNIVLVVAGLLIMRRYPRLGLASCLLGVVSLYLLSLGPVANGLLKTVEVVTPVGVSELQQRSNSGRMAIVVLGAGHREQNVEYEKPWPDNHATLRLNYAAYLHQRTGLPILLTGGNLYSSHATADVMASYLKTLFNIDAKWVERQSRTTEENAILSYQMLEQEGIDQIVLVTQSVHMRRSILLFENTGFTVLPAPTALSEPHHFLWGRLVPRIEALSTSSMVIHEWLGFMFYKVRGY